MQTFETWISRLADHAGLLTSLIVLVPLLITQIKKLKARAREHSKESVRREIAEFGRLVSSPSYRAEFMLMRLLLIAMVVGFWLMLRNLGVGIVVTQHPGLDYIFGAAIYLLAAIGIGTIRAIRNPQVRLDRLRERLKQLEGENSSGAMPK